MQAHLHPDPVLELIPLAIPPPADLFRIAMDFLDSLSDAQEMVDVAIAASQAKQALVMKLG